MNPEAFSIMKRFAKKYLPVQRGLSVCDIGSLDVNGTFRSIFENHGYVGLDIVPGPNVDIVSKDPYHYPFDDETFDVVISGATLEHIQDIYTWAKELKRILKIGGTLCVMAPACYPKLHRYPHDCWRIYPDGMRFLFGTVAGLQIIRVRLTDGKWSSLTCVCIARRNA